MTIADLRSLAGYHQRESIAYAAGAALGGPGELRQAELAVWHAEMARKCHELGDGLQAAAQIISNLKIQP